MNTLLVKESFHLPKVQFLLDKCVLSHKTKPMHSLPHVLAISNISLNSTFQSEHEFWAYCYVATMD